MNNETAAEAQLLVRKLANAEKLTREYARFSSDARGLGHVLGGGLTFLTMLLLNAHSLGIIRKTILCLVPVIWITGKQWLQEHYYQSEGMVTQLRSQLGLVILAGVSGAMAILNSAISILLIYRLLQQFEWGFAFSLLICVPYLLAMPFLVWRYLRAPYEFLVGIFLLSLPPLVLAQSIHTISRIVIVSLKIPAAIVAVVMLVVGCSEHVKFLKVHGILSQSED